MSVNAAKPIYLFQKQASAIEPKAGISTIQKFTFPIPVFPGREHDCFREIVGRDSGEPR